MGSITAAVYSSQIAANPSFTQLQKASPQVAKAVQDSIGGAVIAAAALPQAVGDTITAAANSAFIHAMDRTVIVAAVVALAGAAIAYLFLPARPRSSNAMDDLVDDAAARLKDDPQQRLGLARATLGLLADAGMSSLTYNAIAARSGVGTATLQRYWTSRVDGVTDAMREVFESHPIPQGGDIFDDLHDYIYELAGVLSDPRARQVVAALVAAGASDPELATALRERVVGPRRAELAARLAADPDRLKVPVDAAVDQLVGPIYHRALILDLPSDQSLLDAIVSGVVAERPNPSQSAAVVIT
jgi:AcrR family transcriptional regulator